ncbi:hypothetical protein [Planotetraspora kaengkrachanensis]|uniref:hypothetical protein n=1 Tax=Planotetraspora kaengkrachanensis TaxID=575193 RepID=UPI003571160F
MAVERRPLVCCAESVADELPPAEVAGTLRLVPYHRWDTAAPPPCGSGCPSGPIPRSPGERGPVSTRLGWSRMR